MQVVCVGSYSNKMCVAAYWGVGAGWRSYADPVEHGIPQYEEPVTEAVMYAQPTQETDMYAQPTTEILYANDLAEDLYANEELQVNGFLFSNTSLGEGDCSDTEL